MMVQNIYRVSQKDYEQRNPLTKDLNKLELHIFHPDLNEARQKLYEIVEQKKIKAVIEYSEQMVGGLMKITGLAYIPKRNKRIEEGEIDHHLGLD